MIYTFEVNEQRDKVKNVPVELTEEDNKITFVGSYKKNWYEYMGEKYKVTKRINDVPVEGEDLNGKVIDFVGKILVAIKAINALVLAAKRLWRSIF